MGRTRTKKKAKATESSSKNPPSVQALLEKAESLIEQCDYDLALRFIKRILDQEPKNVVAREMLGVALLETGDLTFLTLIPPNPDAPSPPPPSAYLYLAQLSDDDPKSSLSYYQSAIDVFGVQLKGKERATAGDGAGDDSEIKSNIVRALIAMVEIWMDPSYDLCFEPDAEKTCEGLLNHALQVDPGNSEALQALASVRMSQERPDDAKACLEEAWSTWKDLDPDDPRLPPLSSRLSMVKLFLELALYTPALLVLKGIMDNDDQDVEAWYLEGWCFYLMSEQAKESGGSLDEMTSEELAKDSRDCLDTCVVLHTNQEHPDEPLLDHAKELISKLEALGIQTSPVEEEEPEGEVEWEDVDSEDEDVEMA
ncbi:hypothetical protein CCMSSC00406_0001935 [Pleurotus cornucopiae]|uniref:Uncharacterized protein n=1 Tax=Pleurotus cornucopiae TaxID=5321 RepID=A0ACB7J4E2_PLECO|nr:hypothetical protein CCMSSC00406_0001935 [Pleurotus cornucopiae]